jgi:putative hemolysin
MAAKNFSDCAKSGGKVVTKHTKSGKTIKICYDSEGKSHAKVVRQGNESGDVSETVIKVCQEPSYSKATETDLVKLKEHFDSIYKK